MGELIVEYEENRDLAVCQMQDSLFGAALLKDNKGPMAFVVDGAGAVFHMDLNEDDKEKWQGELGRFSASVCGEIVITIGFGHVLSLDDEHEICGAVGAMASGMEMVEIDGTYPALCSHLETTWGYTRSIQARALDDGSFGSPFHADDEDCRAIFIENGLSREAYMT